MTIFFGYVHIFHNPMAFYLIIAASKL